MVFTLELMNGEVCGSDTVELKVSACPGRDRRAEERGKSSPSSEETICPTLLDSPSMKHVKRPQSDNKIYMLPVRGLKNYNVRISQSFLTIFINSFNDQRYCSNHMVI